MKRSINTKIWDDTWFESISAEHKLFWLYLLTNRNTNMLGIYELSIRKMAFETGLPEETINKAFESFQSVKKAKYAHGYVIIFNFIKNQSYNTNMKKSAVNEYNNLPNNLKISVGNVIEHNLSESFGTVWKDYITLPNIEVEGEVEGEKEYNANKDLEGFKNLIVKTLEGKERSIDLLMKDNKINIKLKDKIWADFLKNTVINSPILNGETHAWNCFKKYVTTNATKYTNQNNRIQFDE